jgi:cytochrome c oxidase assembly protein subunit 15
MQTKWLFRFSLFTAISTFCLLIAGGMVTSTGSGLAVPDWPLSYGRVMPPMIGGIFYEHGHRMIASFVGLLTVVLTFWIFRFEERRWVRKLAAVGLIAVVIQGLLGGLTVKMMLPPEVSAAHATLAQTFFCVVSALTLFLSPWWLAQTGHKQEIVDSKIRRTLAVVVAVVFVQLILGAVMRHTHSGLAVPDFPLAYEQALPVLSPEKIAEYNDHLIKSDVRLYADGPISREQILIHLSHRYWAVVVFGLVLYASWKLWVLRPTEKRFGLLASFLVLMVLTQVVLGAYTIITRKHEIIATAHQSFGAVLLMLSVISLLSVIRAGGTERSQKTGSGGDALVPEKIL